MDETERPFTENTGSGTATGPFPTLEERIAEARAAAPPPEVVAARRREDIALQHSYPNEYVAYKDTWEPPVFRRAVLAHDPSLKAVHAALGFLSPSERKGVWVTFCDDPAELKGFRGGYDNQLLPDAAPPQN